MDELSRDLMRGEGGLEAINGGLDGNLGQWAQGEAVREMADAGQPPQPRMGYSPSRPTMRPGTLLALLAVIVVLVPDRLPLTPAPDLSPDLTRRERTTTKVTTDRKATRAMPAAKTSDPRTGWEKTWDRLRDSGPVAILAGIAFAGSFGHSTALAERYGQTGWKALATAGCVDLLCVIGAEERQRDKRIGRERRFGFATWPTVVLFFGIIATLAANVATAKPSTWGFIVAGWPALALLLAVSILERRASHTLAGSRTAAEAATARGRRRCSTGSGRSRRTGNRNRCRFRASAREPAARTARRLPEPLSPAGPGRSRPPGRCTAWPRSSGRPASSPTTIGATTGATSR